METVFSAISGFISLALKVWDWFTTRSEQKQGADAQTGRDNAAAVKVESAIAQAEVDAPKTDVEVEQRLKGHTL